MLCGREAASEAVAAFSVKVESEVESEESALVPGSADEGGCSPGVGGDAAASGAAGNYLGTAKGQAALRAALAGRDVTAGT